MWGDLVPSALPSCLVHEGPYVWLLLAQSGNRPGIVEKAVYFGKLELAGVLRIPAPDCST
jgi:hypothetical protein